MERYHRRVTVQVTGLIGILVGLGMVLALPVGKSIATDFSEFNQIKGQVQWAYIIGSCVFVWGLVTVRNGRWRSLTPSLGFLATLPAMFSWTISQYIYLEPPDYPPWTPPETVFHAIGEMFTRGGGVLFAPLLFGIGIAVARKERGWVIFGFIMVVVVSLINMALLRLPGPLLQVEVIGGLIQQWLYSLFYGTPPFLLGYLVAQPRQHETNHLTWVPKFRSQSDR